MSSPKWTPNSNILWKSPPHYSGNMKGEDHEQRYGRSVGAVMARAKSLRWAAILSLIIVHPLIDPRTSSQSWDIVDWVANLGLQSAPPKLPTGFLLFQR